MRTIAVDWSGRQRDAARHIWAAEVAAGELVALSNGRTAPQLAGWLVDQASRGDELAVGLDFAFSLPAWYLRSLGVAGGPELWEVAEAEGESWLSACEAPFWGRKGTSRPVNQEHFRRTEREVSPVGPGAIRPKSVFQIGGAGAVGTGSIRGMAILARLRREGFSVWPFDAAGWPRALEIYPRLLTGPVTKSSQAARTHYLAGLGWPADRCLRERAASTEDAFDAAMSALRMYEHQDDVAVPPPVPEVAALEGWIWCPRPVSAGSPPKSAKLSASVAGKFANLAGTHDRRPRPCIGGRSPLHVGCGFRNYEENTVGILPDIRKANRSNEPVP